MNDVLPELQMQHNEVLQSDSSSLHLCTIVSISTNEKEKLINDIDQQAKEYRKIYCDLKTSRKQQIQKHKEH